MDQARVWARSVLRVLVPLAAVLAVLGALAVLTGGGASAWIAVVTAWMSVVVGVAGLDKEAAA